MATKLLIVIYSFVLITSAFAQDYYDPVQPNELGCLEREWGEINPTEADKQFDIENDFDESGERISCRNYITPTELNNFFVKIKKAVQQRDKEALADLIRFPSHTLLDGREKPNEQNIRKSKSRDIKDKQDFIEHYDEIMIATTIKIIQCMQLNNIFAHPYMGTGTTAGEIWIYKDVDTRELSVNRLSSRPEDDKHWLDQECSW